MDRHCVDRSCVDRRCVDKTEHIYNLLADGGTYYFLSRPRRFGKSLLISTLKEMFSGNKELFKGLWIYDKITWEKYPVIYLLLKLVGIDIETEVETNVGRIDAVIQTDTAVYVVEFKLGTAETAMNQIKEKQYHQKYLNSGKPVHLLGIGLDPEKRNISDHLMETAS